MVPFSTKHNNSLLLDSNRVLSTCQVFDSKQDTGYEPTVFQSLVSNSQSFPADQRLDRQREVIALSNRAIQHGKDMLLKKALSPA